MGVAVLGSLALQFSRCSLLEVTGVEEERAGGADSDLFRMVGWADATQLSYAKIVKCLETIYLISPKELIIHGMSLAFAVKDK